MQPNTKDIPEGYQFNPSILREYDIRGQIDKTLSTDDAYALGLAFGTFVKRRKLKRGNRHTICVGYDGRTSSPGMAEALTRGLMETGAKVENIGLGPTPMLYFSVKDCMADAGIMVTGSHNPPDYNGFKMTLQDGPVFGKLIQEIGKIAADGDFEYEPEVSFDHSIDIQDQYVERLLKDLTESRELKIAWDAGNGATGEILRRLVKKLPGEHTLLFDEIDGNFPNHHPDPTVDENLEDLKKVVLDEGCDLGIAFDGDGDRIGVLDNKGHVLRCDILMTLYAKDVLNDHPGAAIVGDVKCSQVMFDEIEKMGGQGVLWKTGHSLIKDKMLELKAPLAGELSGHIFFADKYYGFDDALYCAVRLINIVAASGNSLHDDTAHINNLFNTPEVRFEVDEDEKFDLVPRVFENLKPQQSDDLQINDIDGVRVSTPDGWWLLRPSNTQNVLVARAESSTEEGLARLITMAQNEVHAIGYTLEFPKD